VNNISNCNIEETDWNECWNNIYKDSHKKVKKHKKTWNDNAKNFNLWLKHDDYPEKLINRMELNKNDTVLDLGSGDGTVTMKIASKVKKVTAVDSYKNMLDFLEENANNAGIKNIEYVEADINDITLETIGNYDVVLASRSISGIMDVKDKFIELDKIANKSVYFSLIGAQPDYHIKKISELLNREYEPVNSAIYAYNLLFQLGIYANLVNLECDSQHQYEDIDDAYSRLDWKLKGIKDNEKDIVMNFLKENLFKNENGKLVNKLNKPDWVLIWWKKQINS
jgi:ubiquinone/menaquinone biosynthesis C-methylase UbiE